MGLPRQDLTQPEASPAVLLDKASLRCSLAGYSIEMAASEGGEGKQVGENIL